MSFAFALQALSPSATDATPHILGFSTARTATDDLLVDIWNGSTSAGRVAALDLEGRWSVGDGTEAKPALRPLSDPNSGFYAIGADNLGLSLGGTKRWDFAAAGSTLTGTLTVSGAVAAQSTLAVTGTSALTGRIGAGASPNAAIGLNLSYSSALSGTEQWGIRSIIQAQSDATSWGRAVMGRADTAAASFTMTNSAAFYAANPTVGAGSTITNTYGLYVESISSGTNNYAIYTNDGAVRFGGAVTAASTLAVTGNTTLAGTLDSSGEAIFRSGVTRGTTTGFLNISGGSTSALGANIRLHGESHAADPGRLRFRVDTTTVGTYNASGWDISVPFSVTGQTSTLAGISSTVDTFATRAVDTASLNISGGTGASTGANIQLFGSTHATTPSAIIFRSSATERGRITGGILAWGTTATTGASAGGIKVAAASIFDSTLTVTGAATLNGGAAITGFFNIGGVTGAGLTISAGAVTATRSYHLIDTEASAATDDLDTINGGSIGDLLIIQANTSTRTVVVKNGTGNLSLNGSDCTLDNSLDRLTLIRATPGWVEISRSDNGA